MTPYMTTDGLAHKYCKTHNTATSTTLKYLIWTILTVYPIWLLEANKEERERPGSTGWAEKNLQITTSPSFYVELRSTNIVRTDWSKRRETWALKAKVRGKFFPRYSANMLPRGSAFTQVKNLLLKSSSTSVVQGGSIHFVSLKFIENMAMPFSWPLKFFLQVLHILFHVCSTFFARPSSTQIWFSH